MAILAMGLHGRDARATSPRVTHSPASSIGGFSGKMNRLFGGRALRCGTISSIGSVFVTQPWNEKLDRLHPIHHTGKVVFNGWEEGFAAGILVGAEGDSKKE